MPELNTSIFIIPGEMIKNSLDRLVTSFPRPQACRCGYFPEYASGCSELGHFA